MALTTRQLLASIVDTRARASIELESIPARTRASVTTMVREAQEELKKMLAQYTQQVRGSSLGILLFGDQSRIEKFLEISQKEAGVLHVKADGLYQLLAERVFRSVGPSGEFGSAQIGMLKEVLGKTLQELGLPESRPDIVTDVVCVHDVEETTAHIRFLLRNANLMTPYMNKSIADAALAANFSSKTLPVAVTGLTQEEAGSMAALFTTCTTVSVGTSEDGDVDQEYVLSKLKDLRKKAKTNTAQ